MSKRGLGATLALIAAGLMIVAALSKSWWAAERGVPGGPTMRNGAGPMGGETCVKDECKSGDLPTQKGFKTLGLVALIGLLGAGAFGFIASMLAFTKKPSKGLMWLALITGVLALGASLTFAFRVPQPKWSTDIGWGFYAACSGGVLAIIAGGLLVAWAGSAAGSPYAIHGAGAAANPQARTLMMGQTARSAGPEAATIAPGHNPMPPAAAARPSKAGAAMVPPCPRCHGPLQYAGQFKSWFCPRCQQYVSV